MPFANGKWYLFKSFSELFIIILYYNIIIILIKFVKLLLVMPQKVLADLSNVIYASSHVKRTRR